LVGDDQDVQKPDARITTMAKTKQFRTIETNGPRPGEAFNEISAKLEEIRAQIVLVRNNANQGDQAFAFDKPSKVEVRRLLIVFIGLPIHLTTVQQWREWAVDKEHHALLDFRMVSVPEQITDEQLLTKIGEVCASWFVPNPVQETCGLSLGQFVTMPDGGNEKDDPSHLTLLFGSMGHELTQIELVARRFKDALKDFKNAKSYLDAIDKLLAETDPRNPLPDAGSKKAYQHPNPGIGRVNDKIPKLLLLGETGVGKTLVARHIAQHCGVDRPAQISIPEFLNNENMLEYELFGYAAGAYTGGIQEGSHGRFLEKVGGVVFLDEIGEASPAIQSKLLTFLDHFNVSPRGWDGDPFYCPILIVAATNQDLAKRGIRPELINRFTDTITIPPLRNRMQDLELILDCLLQRESMNPKHKGEHFVREIGKDALDSLRKMSFKDGNFRELENLFREACKRAHVQNRPYLVQADFQKTT
jgi:hypothetical protein